jgi:hypothetical protein
METKIWFLMLYFVHKLSGTIIRGTPRLLISAGNPHQHKAAKAWWVLLSQGSVHSRTRSRLARAQPQARAADPGGFTSRPRAPSSNGHTFGSPEAQSSPRSNLGQIATPTDRTAEAFNARMAWHLILTRASSRQSRSDRSHFVAPLTGLTRGQHRLCRSDCCATRQSEADSSQVRPRAP